MQSWGQPVKPPGKWNGALLGWRFPLVKARPLLDFSETGSLEPSSVNWGWEYSSHAETGAWSRSVQRPFHPAGPTWYYTLHIHMKENFEFTELWVNWTFSLLNFQFTELSVYWTLSKLNFQFYWTLSKLNFQFYWTFSFTELSVLLNFEFTELWANWTFSKLNFEFTELWVNWTLSKLNFE